MKTISKPYSISINGKEIVGMNISEIKIEGKEGKNRKHAGEQIRGVAKFLDDCMAAGQETTSSLRLIAEYIEKGYSLEYSPYHKMKTDLDKI